MSDNQSARELLVVALGVGVDTWTALEGVGMTTQEYNIARREASFHEVTKLAEEEGRAVRDRIEKMRGIVATYDETVDSIKKRAEEFRKRKASRNLQMDLMP